MNKKQEVLKAYKRVEEEVGTALMGRLGTGTILELVQEKLPTRPLYSTATIRKILNARSTKGEQAKA